MTTIISYAVFFVKSGSTQGSPCRWRTHLELRQSSHDVLPVALKLAAGVPHQAEVSQVDVVPQRRHAAQATHKVHHQVQFLQTLTAWKQEDLD